MKYYISNSYGFRKEISSGRYLEHIFYELRKLDRETILFLLPSHIRMSATIDGLSKLDMIELLVKEHIISL